MPLVERAASPVVQRVGSVVLGDTGRAATASAVQGMTANMADYGMKTGWNGDAAGWWGSAGTSLVTGAGGSIASSKLGAAALSKLDMTPEVPAGWCPYLGAPNVTDARAAVTTTVDHFTSGVQSMINETIRPEGEGPAAGLRNGLFSGAEGPYKPVGAHAG